MRKLVECVLFIGVLFYLQASYAIGNVTNNVMGVAKNVNSIATGIALIIGVGMVVGAGIQYQQHRRNKLQVPISKPIFIFILGCLLLLLPLLGSVVPGGKLLS